jgi:cell wall-associated NlpC family hydrolase
VRRALPAFLALALALAGCGAQPASRQQRGTPAPAKPAPSVTASQPAAHPQAVEPVAGAVAAASAAGATVGVGATASAAGATVSVGTPPASGLAQPVSDAQIRRELAASGMTSNSGQATITPDGLAIPPVDAPPAVQAIIQAGNQIAHLPYVWGGGHVTYEDTGYDCSGSISFVFQAAHLLSSPVVSGELANWGAPGPGKWITVFANAGHTFMYVAGLRFDTVALAETGTRWSNRSADEPDLGSFAVRHPPGL